MSKIQPGAGYGFTSSGYGYSLNTNEPFDLSQDAAAPDHPFKVRAEFGSNATDLRVYVTAGTVNNIVPSVYGGGDQPLLTDIPQPYSVIAGGSFTAYRIYIRMGLNSTTNAFPTDDRESTARYPQVWYEAESADPPTDPADTDVYAYIKIGRIVVNNSTLAVTATQQFVTGSLWVSRIKVGSLTAQYFYSRI